MAVGLGSSGALAVATVAAVGKLLGKDLSREAILTLSTSAERFVHRNPSGIDQAISTYGGVIVYQRTVGITHLEVASKIPLVIGNTGIIRNTGDLVDRVKRRTRRYPQVMKQLAHTAGQLSKEAIDSLHHNDLNRFGELMDINHGLLVAVGVSHQVIDNLVHAAKGNGALGAKLTGAGGGGCIIALTTVEDRERISEAIRSGGGTPILAEKTDKGVHTWISD
jgi:mevalonate kinase